MQDEIFSLDKTIWTQDDFEIMGWHDATIRGLAFEMNEQTPSMDLLLDIDYIFKWIQPVPPAKSFTFWVAPCTLIFKEAFALKIDIDTNFFVLEGFEIADIHLNKKDTDENGMISFHWEVETQTGIIQLQSQGLLQVVRQKPRHIDEQSFSLSARGGISFGRTPFTIGSPI